MSSNLSSIIASIQSSLVTMSQSSKDDSLVCGQLVLISRHLGHVKRIVDNAKKEKLSQQFKDQVKILLKFSDTLTYWTNLKTWEDICEDLGGKGISEKSKFILEDLAKSIRPQKSIDHNRRKMNRLRTSDGETLVSANEELLYKAKAIPEEIRSFERKELNDRFQKMKEKIENVRIENDRIHNQNMSSDIKEEEKKGFLPNIFRRR